MATAGISGRAIALAAAGGILVYAGLRGESPLAALRGILTGKPGPVPTGTPITLSGAPSGTLAPASGAVGQAVQIALQQVGKPYRWGATGPDRFDCSGLIYYAYNKAGIKLPRFTSWAYPASSRFQRITREQVAAGDVCWKPGHVALAISNSQIVEAPRTGIPVRTRELSGFTSYHRYVGG